MKRITRLFALSSILALAACGGAQPIAGAPGAERAAAVSGAEAQNGENSIGNQILAQGGFAVLGGAAVPEPEALLGPPLAMRAVLTDAPVKLDGLLKEWPRLSPAKIVTPENSSVKASFAVQYDEEKIYVAGEIEAPRFTRTAKMALSEDHVVLSMGIPNGALYTGFDLGIFAGKSGETAGAIKHLSGAHKGEELEGTKIVEAPSTSSSGGYAFEAAIPWSAFGSPKLRMGLRGALGVALAAPLSAVGPRTGENLGKGASAPKSLPQLLTEPEIAVLEGLLEPKGLAQNAPSFDIFSDVTGDGVKERVAIYGHYLTICGPKYREGKQFFFRDLGGDGAGLEARTLTQKGRDDLLVRKRVSVQQATHEVLEIWSFKNDEPETVFAQQLSVFSSAKQISNAARIRGGVIEVTVDKGVGWDAASYSEPTLDGAEPLLLPWGSTKLRSYRFEGGRFVRNKEAAAESSHAPVTTTPVSAALPKDLPTPKVSKGSEATARSGTAMLEDFRKARSVAADVKPKADLSVSVSEDPRPERVLLVERDLLVLGPGFRGGARYEYLSLEQFEKPSDITEVTARDLTGDGSAEIIVRGQRRTTAGGADVTSDVMFIYTVDDKGIRRIFSIETGRSIGKKRIQGMVQFVPGAKSFEIDVQPGVAKGFTEKTYPFSEESPGGALEPLLTPWGKTKKLHYTWNGTKFAVGS
jgi:hypothetical protein